MKLSIALLQQATEAVAPVTKNIDYYEQLPQILKNFFHKHLPATDFKYSTKPVSIDDPTANPFLPNRNPATNKYHGPIYSLRRQSVLYKTAARYGIADLLPQLNKKFFDEKYAEKTFMKGVLRPKGHKYEIQKPIKQEKIKQAMENMEATIAKVKGAKYVKKLEEKKKSEKSRQGWY